MTTTEQLQFSVLTAPVATLDRRTLSQAWYSALYGTAQKPGPQKTTAAIAPATAASCARAHATIHEPVAHGSRAGTRARRANESQAAAGAPGERRAPRSPLARKIERAFLKPRSASRKNAFTVEGEHGRVHVLLQTRGTHLKLVAICPQKARTHVAAALAQARYALALRGIDLETQLRETQPC